MAKLRFLTTSLFLICSLLTYAQKQSAKIKWGNPLRWAYFQGQPDYSTPYLASSNTGVISSFKWGYKDQKPQLKYHVYAVFNPYTSWVKPAKKSVYLLRHEQLHFDISELTARKLRKFLSRQNYKPQKVSKKVNRKSKALKKQNKRIQDRYDRQTKHGTKPKKQEKWERKIHQKLDRLNDYQNL